MKRFYMDADLFYQIKDITEVLLMPHNADGLDDVTREQLREIFVRVCEMDLDRYLSNMQRKAYISGDMDAVGKFKAMRERYIASRGIK